MPSPTPDPGDVAPKPMAQIERGSVQRQLRGGCPELKLVAVTVAAMAKVTADRHVHRETAAIHRPGLMQRTTSVPLHAGSLHRLESQQVEHLLHRDLRTDAVEVDTWHRGSSLGDGVRGPFRSPSTLSGERERPCSELSQVA